MSFKLSFLITFVTLFSTIPVYFSGCTSDIHSSNHYQPTIQKLENIIASDSKLRTNIASALSEQNSKSYWYQHTTADMLDFLNEWLTYPPKPDDVRKYMDAFYEFAGAGKGREIASSEPFKSWLYDYMIAIGKFMDSSESAKDLPLWFNNPSINMADYIVPEDGFKSFNAFFTRSLKPGARPVESIEDASVLVSPADSSLIKLSDNVTAETNFGVKGGTINIRELLGNDGSASKFINGKVLLCMLDTTDYHHFHSPVTGRIVASKQLAGLYYGTTSGWTDYFFEHHRGYYIFDTAKYGYVGMSCIGMFTISSISFSKSEGNTVKKGDELGYFAYGGSAIILLFEPDRVSFDFPASSSRNTHVLMGQRIGTIK
jgi:phosphatidylserine decarboxylase